MFQHTPHDKFNGTRVMFTSRVFEAARVDLSEVQVLYRPCKRESRVPCTVLFISSWQSDLFTFTGLIVMCNVFKLTYLVMVCNVFKFTYLVLVYDSIKRALK